VSVNRLGKGLEALIRPKKDQKKKPSKKPVAAKPGITEIPLKDIRPNPNQPRRYFDESALDELAASIKEKGVVTPVTVREVDSGYELVAGERRWRASKKSRKKTIPAYVIAVKDDAEMLEMALIENIQREDLNPLEESDAYAVLNSKFDMSHVKMCERGVRPGRLGVSSRSLWFGVGLGQLQHRFAQFLCLSGTSCEKQPSKRTEEVPERCYINSPHD
jgi:ParB family chromosome partitioning protein